MYYYVYIIENKFENWYTGYTTNIRQRIKDHNTGKNVSTRGQQCKLIYAELYLDKKDALGREKFLKSGGGKKFIKKQIQNYLKKESYANTSSARFSAANRTTQNHSHQ